MINEHAYLTIDPANAAKFEAAVAEARACFEELDYCYSMNLAKIIETPGKYILIVTWESLEHHMVNFRESENFQTWRGLVGSFFTEAPQVEHAELTTFFKP